MSWLQWPVATGFISPEADNASLFQSFTSHEMHFVSTAFLLHNLVEREVWKNDGLCRNPASSIHIHAFSCNILAKVKKTESKKKNNQPN